MLRRIGNDTTQDERSSSFKFRMQKHELISRCHAIIYRLCPMIRDIEKLMSSNDPSITVIGRILSESRVIRTRSHVGLSCFVWQIGPQKERQETDLYESTRDIHIQG
eukprot:1137794_1